VDVGQPAGDRAQVLDEVRKVVREVVLLVLHRRRVVDHEQQIEVAVDVDRDVLGLDPALLWNDEIDGTIGTAGEKTDRETHQRTRNGRPAHGDLQELGQHRATRSPS
jgi:hypothetical protein